MDLHPIMKSEHMETVSQLGYLNLVKASWILIDLIVRHPQLAMSMGHGDGDGDSPAPAGTGMNPRGYKIARGHPAGI
jgi:hypothetical protein